MRKTAGNFNQKTPVAC